MIKLLRASIAIVGLGVLAAACGSGRPTQQTAIEAAIERSPYTYFAYRDPLYWGRPVHFTISRVRISTRDPRFAAAIVTPLEGNQHTHASDPERVLLRSTGRWRVIRA